MMVEGYPGEIKEKIQRQALQRKREMQTAAAEEKQQKQGYDPTATPSRIAKLGQPVSEARFQGALASLAYEENRMEELNRKLAEEESTSKLPATLGAMGKWLKSDTELEQRQTQRRIQKLQNRIPQLEYETWADQGLTRPEEYTAENVADYEARLTRLASMQGNMTKEMKQEAGEILKTTHPSGTLGNAGTLLNFAPYVQAVEAEDEEAAQRWAGLYYQLDAARHPIQYAVMKNVMEGSGYSSLLQAGATLIGDSNTVTELEAMNRAGDIASVQNPVVGNVSHVLGRMALVNTLGLLSGNAMTALGIDGIMGEVASGILTGAGTETITGAGDFVTGKISGEEYAKKIETGGKMGGVAQAAAGLISEGAEQFENWWWNRNRQGNMENGLIPVPPYSGAALVGNGGTNVLSMLPEVGGSGKTNSLSSGAKTLAQKETEEFDKAFLKGYNEDEDREEWEHFREVLGKNEVPQNFKQFQEIKYECPEIYETIKHGTEYIENRNRTLKEEMESGRAREETREAFIRRGTGEGLGIYEGETVAYGFRRVGDAAGCRTGKQTQTSFETKEELKKLGIQADIFEGDLLINKGNITYSRIIPQAATIGHKYIVINCLADMRKEFKMQILLGGENDDGTEV